MAVGSVVSSRAILCLALLGATGASLCACKEAPRASSTSRQADSPPGALPESLTLLTVAREDPVLGSRATFRAEVEGTYDNVLLLLPSGATVALMRSADQHWRFEDEGPLEEMLTRYPAGIYTARLVPQRVGRTVTLSVVGEADLPDPPLILEPVAEATGLSTRPSVAWLGHSPAYQVSVTTTGVLPRRRLLADGLEGEHFELLSEALEPFQTYLLEVRALSAASGRFIRAFATIVTVSTGAAGAGGPQ